MIQFKPKMRQAFSMITAIFVMLMLSTVGAYVVNIAGKNIKATTLQYYKEQSALLAKSYTELAIMGATANDPTEGNCLETVSSTVGDDPNKGEGYSIDVRLAYIGSSLTCSPDGTIINHSDIPSDQMYVMIDVFVRYRDFGVIGAVLDGGGAIADVPWITYHRRTLQRL